MNTTTCADPGADTQQRPQAAWDELYNATCAVHDAHTAHFPGWVDAAIAHVHRADDAYTEALAAAAAATGPTRPQQRVTE